MIGPHAEAFEPITDDLMRYRLTHELWMLYQMRYNHGGPYCLASEPERVREKMMERERALMAVLGLDERPR